MEFLVLGSVARDVGEILYLIFYFISATAFLLNVVLTILSKAGLSGIKSAL